MPLLHSALLKLACLAVFQVTILQGHKHDAVHLQDAFVVDHEVLDSAFVDGIVKVCDGKVELIEFEENHILCINGLISPEIGKELSSFKGAIDFLYLNSPGGDVSTSLDIGLRIETDSAKVIVDEFCHSSCANYLVMSGYSLYMTNNTVITMHGNPSRNPTKIITGYDNYAKNDDTLPIVAEFMEGGEMLFDYDLAKKVVKEQIDGLSTKELQYFGSLYADEAYVTRYFEVKRTLSKRDQPNCFREGLLLVITPDYLDEFGANIIRSWEPKSHQKYIELLPKLSNERMVVIGFNEHPIWVGGIGSVSPQTCQSNLK